METTRISLDVPKTWLKAIKQAALDENSRTMQELIRNILLASPVIQRGAAKAEVTLEPLEQQWGGRRNRNE